MFDDFCAILILYFSAINCTHQPVSERSGKWSEAGRNGIGRRMYVKRLGTDKGAFAEIASRKVQIP